MIKYDHEPTPNGLIAQADHAARLAPKSPNTATRFCSVCHRVVVRRPRVAP